MADDFDMYADLLGIERGPRPPDYYTLIGVPPTETDVARIHAAAKRRITRLSAMLAGDRANFAQQLMGEVATARAVLTTPEVKARYDEKMLSKLPSQSASAPVHERDGSSAPTAAAAHPEELAQTMTMGGEFVAVPVDVAGTIETVSDPAFPSFAGQGGATENPTSLAKPPAGAPAVTKARLVAGPGAAFSPAPPVTSAAVDAETLPRLPPAVHDGGVPLPLPVAIDSVLLSTRPPVTWPDSVPPAATMPFDAVPTSYAPSAKYGGKRRSHNSQLVLTAGLLFAVLGVGVGVGAMLLLESRRSVAGQANADDASVGQGQAENRGAGGDQRSDVAPNARTRKSPQNHVLADKTLQPSASRERPSASDATAGDKPVAWTEAKKAPKEKAMRAAPEAKPAAPPKSDEAPLDPAKAEAVTKPLVEARKALAARDFAKADAQLDVAEAAASTAGLRAKVADERALRHYVDRFWNAVRESMRTIKSGAELSVDDGIVSVVEFVADGEKLIVHSKGKNGEYTAQQLPLNLAVALAKDWLDPKDPNSPAFIGAYLILSERKSEAEQGWRMLEEAKSAGSDVATAVLETFDRK